MLLPLDGLYPTQYFANILGHHASIEQDVSFSVIYLFQFSSFLFQFNGSTKNEMHCWD